MSRGRLRRRLLQEPAAIAVASSVDIKTVSVLLGHADPAMTLRTYADSLEASKRAGIEQLDGIL